MLSWRKACTVLTVILLAMVLLLNQFGSPLTSYHMEQQVTDYLQKQGYQQQDLASLKAVYNRNEQHKYMVEVIFTDAPDKVHAYYYDVENGIKELERIGE